MLAKSNHTLEKTNLDYTLLETRDDFNTILTSIHDQTKKNHLFSLKHHRVVSFLWNLVMEKISIQTYTSLVFLANQTE
jgi:hypothetical protein